MKYFHPKSLTWWTGVGSLALGILMIAEVGGDLSGPASVVSAISGGTDPSPPGLIVFGLGLIGVRDKLERMS